MTIQIYHLKPEHFGESFFMTMEDVKRRFEDKQNNYDHVADVSTDDLDEAFRLTNHIEGEWQKNAGVRSNIRCARRSTSEGDVAVKADGTRWFCAHVGWTQF
jgi:hypothetical protein